VGGRVEHEDFAVLDADAEADVADAAGSAPRKEKEVADANAVARNGLAPIGVGRAAGGHGVAKGAKKVLLQARAVEAAGILASGAVGVAQHVAVARLEVRPRHGVGRGLGHRGQRTE